MVEVVRNGYETRIECECCHSELKYSSDDIKCGDKYIDEDYWVTPYYIKCPVCGNKIRTGGKRELTYEAEKRINSYQPFGGKYHDGMGFYD